MVSITLIVFFDDPFWVGLVERTDGARLVATRFVFGAEPSERQVYEWVLREMRGLRFSPSVEGENRRVVAKNPKRRQRQAAQSIVKGVGTKSQQALALGHELAKAERAQRRRQARTEEKERRFQLHEVKKKAKRRGH